MLNMLGNTQLAEAKQSQQNITTFQGGVNHTNKTYQKEIVICIFPAFGLLKGETAASRWNRLRRPY